MENPFETILLEIQALRRELTQLREQIEAPRHEPETELMTVKEVAEYMSIAVPTVYRKVCQRELPYMKQNGRLYFDRAEIKQYIKGGRVDTLEEMRERAFDHLRPPRRRK